MSTQGENVLDCHITMKRNNNYESTNESVTRLSTYVKCELRKYTSYRSKQSLVPYVIN